MSQIYSTKNYDMFTSLKGNRGKTTIQPRHLDALEKSILERNLLDVNPIIVDKSHIVINGHHRLAVAKKNNLLIYYTIVEDADYKDAIRLTRGTSNWTLKEYLECFMI